MNAKKVELLAPAGSPEGFYGAVHAGADAVYLGGSKFGARAYAENFTEEELVRCIRYAHIFGRRIYLTVNTLMKDQELEELESFLRPYYEAGLDGVIVQDLGVLLLIRKRFPELSLHASTQMTLTGPWAANYIKSLGVSRIVPARELSLSEIRSLKEKTGLEIEAFIHGAMCYCYSGQCLFSSILGGRSGNRGRCAQPCRLPYTVITSKGQSGERYPLSLKDMCTVEYLPQLIEAGIDSFKIEGRMKKPEYTAGVTAIYRRQLDRYYAHPDQKPQVMREDLDALKKLYVRSGLQNGYYEKYNGADMVAVKNPAYSGSDEALLSDIRRTYLEQRLLLPVAISARFRQGEAAEVTFVCQGHRITVTGQESVPALKQPITEENVITQLTKLNDTAFRADKTEVFLEPNVFYPLKAINELRRRAVRALEDELILSHGLCPGRQKIMPNLSETYSDRRMPRREESRIKDGSSLTVSISSLAQLEALAAYLEESKKTDAPLYLRRVYINADLLAGPESEDKRHPEQNSRIKKARMLTVSLRENAEIYLTLPSILREKETACLTEVLKTASKEEISGCMVRSLEGYAYLKEQHFNKPVAADAGFYIWNRQTLAFWKCRLNSFCLPWELNEKEQRGLLAALEGYRDFALWPDADSADQVRAAEPEKIIYGYIPMMLTANCVLKTTGSCIRRNEGGRAFLLDRYQKRFPVIADCIHCINTIYNTVPFSLHKSFENWKNKAYLRLDMTVETAAETMKILSYFHGLLSGKAASEPFVFSEYTTGHEKRGVE